MVHDNPYLEVWRSLSLDQTELNIFANNLDWTKLEKWSSFHMVSPQPIYNLTPPFMLIVDKGGEKFTKIVRDSKIEGANS